jgi:hypothetical protein
MPITRTIIRNGKWKRVRLDGFEGCCDCGLIHRVQFRTRNGKLMTRVFRAKRLTAEARKRFKYPCRKS